MKKTLVVFMVMTLTMIAAQGCKKENTAPPDTNAQPDIPDRPGWELVWNDEFNGATLDSKSWNRETGGGGWGNNELQFYTNRTENAYLADGSLIIEARRESYGGNDYTSARLTTQGKHSFRYGRIEARIKLPKGQGIWPAFWMLGESISTVGWPACGEIDIMEMIGGGEDRDDTVYGTAHWLEENAGHQYQGGHLELPDPQIFADDYHLFAIEWDSTTIKWLMDDQPYYTFDITPGARSEFHAPFFIILNVAVGGNWPGNPDTTTVFPQRMYVDFVRVYRRK